MNFTSNKSSNLKDYELIMIQLVVDFGRIIGLPKSVCEIYGLLFCSLEELSMDQISRQLAMSLGSASQGLKILKELGAVKVIYRVGERKDHFQAEFNFRRIITKFLSDEMQPQLEKTELQLKDIDVILKNVEGSNKSEISDRVDILRKLNSRAKGIIPAVSKILRL